MIVICIGPVCIPGHMILAALLGFLHQYGLLTWIKQEWVTYRYWRNRWRRWRSGGKPSADTGSGSAGQTAAGSNGTTSAMKADSQEDNKPVASDFQQAAAANGVPAENLRSSTEVAATAASKVGVQLLVDAAAEPWTSGRDGISQPNVQTTTLSVTDWPVECSVVPLPCEVQAGADAAGQEPGVRPRSRAKAS